MTQDALKANGDRVEQSEQEAGTKGRPRAPFGEDQRRQRNEALAGRHIGKKSCRLSDRQIGPGEAAQNAADDDRRISKAGDGNSRRVDRSRVFPHGAQAQSEAGSPEHESGGRNRQEREDNQRGMPQDDVCESLVSL